MFEKIPRALFLLSTSAKIPILGKETDKDNLMTIDWVMPLSKEPMMCAIAVKKNRFTYQILKKSNVFILNLMDSSKKKQVRYCGENSGEFLDKFAKTGLTRIEGKTIHCCAIKEAIARYECEIIDEIQTGDHSLFIAKISDSEEGANIKKSPLLHYMKGYCALDDAIRVKDAKK